MARQRKSQYPLADEGKNQVRLDVAQPVASLFSSVLDSAATTIDITGYEILECSAEGADIWLEFSNAATILPLSADTFAAGVYRIRDGEIVVLTSFGITQVHARAVSGTGTLIINVLERWRTLDTDLALSNR